MMAGLEDVKGLGPAKVAKLHAAGIHDLQDLASLDLRRPHEIGIGNDVLKDAKRQARQLLDKEGVPYSKAPYGEASGGQAKPASKSTSKAATKTATKASAAAEEPASEPAAPAAPRRRGLLARLLGRS